MDTRTMIVLLTTLGVIGGGLFMLARASNENTRIKAEASVAKAQEHTKRAEGRQNNVDVLGFFRGWKQRD